MQIRFQTMVNYDKLKNLKAKVIGKFEVDSGLVWIGDPCYILHTDKLPLSLGTNWTEFCDKINNLDSKEFNFNNGTNGLGVLSATGGDGGYNVIGFYDNENLPPLFILIDFID